MKNTESLKKNRDFRIVYQNGKSVANRYLVLYKFPNTQDSNRLGISVSKKVGNSVVRSRVTRLIRESYRLNEELIVYPGWDFIVIARGTANGASFKEISSALKHLLRQQKVFEENS
ncbi:ribonuclease P protein component [Clostridium sp.]|uniref:ribonuclease P protein component n=1 Tax=Clostridium sp. TaxID=1506 RepID=UPI003F3E0FB4